MLEKEVILAILRLSSLGLEKSSELKQREGGDPAQAPLGVRAGVTEPRP